MSLCASCGCPEAPQDQWSGPKAHEGGCECIKCVSVCWGSNCAALKRNGTGKRRDLERRTVELLERMDYKGGLGLDTHERIRALLAEWRAAGGGESR